MQKTKVQKLSEILRVLVLIVFVCNLLVLPMVPGLVIQLVAFGPERLLAAIRSMVGLEGSLAMTSVWRFLIIAPTAVWQDCLLSIVTLAYWLCLGCTAVIEWQAKCVLDTILHGNPFQLSNARALKRASICCWTISAAALVRLFWWIWHDGTLAPLLTYTALFVPGFFMAGLLFLVMSALFCQAAELQEDRDLTI